MNISCFYVCAKGLSREKNEDCICINKIIERDEDPFSEIKEEQIINKKCLIAIADGVGGSNGGAFASEDAVSQISSLLEDDNININKIIQSNIDINNYLLNLNDPNISGCATTIALIYFFDDSVFCYNLGDTRILKITEHNLIQISKDHIYDKQNKPNVITQYLGGNDLNNKLIPHKQTYDLLSSDKFIIFSDGLYNYVTLEEIKDQINNKNKKSALKNLVALANQRGGYDNISIIYVDVENI